MADFKIIHRIDTLLKHIKEVETDLDGVSLEDFEKSDLLIRATCFSLVQIGEQMNKLETILRDNYPDLPWSYARNMRNLIVHVYSQVDGKQIYKTAKENLEELKQAFLKIKNEIA